MNLGQLLERQADRHGERRFVTQAETGESLSYAAFNSRANRLARGLLDIGIDPGEHVAIMLSSNLAFLTSSYALRKLGCVEVAVNSTFRGVSLARMINLTSCATLITSSAYTDALADVAESLPNLRRLVLVDPVCACHDDVPDVEILQLDDILHSDDTNLCPSTPDDQTAVILFTSGTTGISKGCAIPDRSSVRAAESMIEAFDLAEDDCVYSPYPLFHVGATQYDILPALMVGGRAVIRDRFSVSSFWSDVVHYGATWFMALGSVQRLLWSAEPCAEERQHNIRFIWGTPLPIDADAFEARFGIRVARGGGYGSTEAGSVALPLFDKPGAGRVLDRYEVRVVDEAGKDLPAGHAGQLIVRAKEPAIMASGYVGMPDATATTWQDGWLHTGDLARVDDAGDLYFVARMSERLRVKGEMVSAFEIEEAICSHPAIEDCAVLGRPDGDGEESIIAFVTQRAGAQVSCSELVDYCRPLISKYMLPAEVIHLDAMPRTPSGKPAKAELRHRC